MFVSNLFQKSRPRKFAFTPFYYNKENETENDDPEQPRIKFRRYRRPELGTSKSVKIKIVFAILLVLFLYYFRGLVEQDNRHFRIEEIKIEETPSNF